VSEETMQRLVTTPGSAIGTSRDQLEEAEYEKMAEVCVKYDIGWILFNGGNGTMDTCGKMYRMCQKKGLDIKVMGIPKTTDNDIAVTDHSPGFASAARFMAQSTKELLADVSGLAIHVVVLEASGRNGGWITAASAMAEDEDGLKPDLIYLPEIPFDEDAYIAKVEELLKTKSGIVVVASEGLKNKEGKPVVKPIFQVGRSTYFGDVSAHLANLVIQRLGYKARGEKPGLLGRASIPLRSEIDVEEAVLAGREACKAALAGESGKMVAFRRISTEPYQMEPFLVSIDEVMMHEKTMPEEFINADGTGVTEAFKQWCRPLLGGPLSPMKVFVKGERQ
jgi:6-phosphofructokinase 1